MLLQCDFYDLYLMDVMSMVFVLCFSNMSRVSLAWLCRMEEGLFPN